MYVALQILPSDSAIGRLLIPLPAVVGAVATALFSFVACVWAPQKHMPMLALAGYLLMTATVGTLIVFTDGVRSPYFALWMVLSVFAGLFGKLALGVLCGAANIGLLYALFFSGAAASYDTAIVFFLALEIPLITSYLIWHGKNTQEQKKNKAFNALAQQLSQVANKSEIVINAIAEGVMAIDTQGVIQLINPAAQELLGWTKQDARGLDYRSVFKLIGINGKELPPEASPIQTVLKTGKPVINNDLAVMTVSGKKLLLSLVVSPVAATNEGTAGAIAVFRDITGEKAEERQKAEFISTASHEMRTPVAAIEGYLGLALNPATAAIDDKARGYLLKAQDATQHLGSLFQDLLTVSRAEDNRLTPKPTVIDIVAFVAEVADSLAQKAQAKGLFLYFKPGRTAVNDQQDRTVTRNVSPIYYAYLDSGHLREAINNLIDNAIKYTRQGSITIDVTGDNQTIAISVADTGIGIPPEDVPHLFQKFYRIDSSDTREIGGTGLGLYISRRLLEANNGRLTVDSVYGRGSVFYAHIPRITHEKAAELSKQPAVQPQVFA